MGVIAGVIIVALLGIVLMCLVQINKENEKTNTKKENIDEWIYLRDVLKKNLIINKNRSKTKYERGYYNAIQDVINQIDNQIAFEEELQNELE